MLQVLVDNQPIEVRSSVTVINTGVTGPVSGAATDILETVYTPNGTIVQKIFGANTPTTTGALKSHLNTTAAARATATNVAG